MDGVMSTLDETVWSLIARQQNFPRRRWRKIAYVAIEGLKDIRHDFNWFIARSSSYSDVLFCLSLTDRDQGPDRIEGQCMTRSGLIPRQKQFSLIPESNNMIVESRVSHIWHDAGSFPSDHFLFKNQTLSCNWTPPSNFYNLSCDFLHWRVWVNVIM